MGLFGKLFDKKVCDICGGEIGLLGNRKLEDGNCCKKCAKKLSPWFNERRHSTVADIKDQIEYREKNKEAVAAFHVTRSFGEGMKVLVDENARRFMVTRASSLEDANPDVLDIDQATACDLDIRESKDEVYREVRDSDGSTKRVSYSPRKYKYSYDFQMTIRVNSPYFDEMEFSLSNGYIHVLTHERSSGSILGISFTSESGRLSESSPTPPTIEERRENAKYAKYERMAEEIRQILLSRGPAAGAGGDKFAPLIAAYQQSRDAMMAAGPEARPAASQAFLAASKALTEAAGADPVGAQAAHVMEVMAPPDFHAAEKPAAPAPAAPAEKYPAFCPQCGAPTTGSKFCENCGCRLQG